jgi:hypothetical protein
VLEAVLFVQAGGRALSALMPVASADSLCGDFHMQGPAAPGAGPSPEITCVAWNQKVQHILASTQVRKQSTAARVVVASAADACASCRPMKPNVQPSIVCRPACLRPVVRSCCGLGVFLCDVQVDGATVVWDLKKQRPVITLKDPNRCAGTSLCTV